MAESGAAVTYAQVDLRSRALARVLREDGLVHGDTLAVVCENRLEWAEIVWAAARSGIDIAPVNFHLGNSELIAMLTACGARAVLTSPDCRLAVESAAEHVSPRPIIYVLDAESRTPDGYEARLSSLGATAQLEAERLGGRVMFSSGTTGAPKAIRHPAADVHPRDAPPHLGEYTSLLDFDNGSVYLSPAPLYHTSPFRFLVAITQLGGTVVCLQRFDPELALNSMQRYGVTHAQFVPTMMIRMDRLPDGIKAAVDLSALKVAITGAAPCPPALKDRLLAWWGPVVHELYGASEGYGNTHIGPQDAVTHRGSVGRALRGQIHITDADGHEQAPGEDGVIWFEGGTQASSGDSERRTVGDIGHVDADGYLYITGRANHIIISGGVNVHPLELENLLSLHPAVADVAVIGEPDEEYGEIVTAYVVSENKETQPARLASELIDHCRERLAHYKCPRKVRIVSELPRGDNGKMYKRRLLGDPTRN